MGRVLCFVGRHAWLRMKWGADLSPYPDADCRGCRRCPRFDIYAYGGWHRAKWADFQPTRPLPAKETR